MWRKYNKSFLINNTNYQYWIQNIEKSCCQKFLFSNVEKNKKINYLYFSYDYESSYPNNHFVILMENNVLLSENAKLFFDKILIKYPDCNLLYSDEDFIDGNNRSQPNYKPDWNKEMFLTNPNYGSLWVVKSELINNAIQILKKNNFDINVFRIIS